MTITIESFGSEVPENWQEIADYLNDIIEERGLETNAEINELWEAYWNGDIPDAPAAK